jgi:hypothetical protein
MENGDNKADMHNLNNLTRGEKHKQKRGTGVTPRLRSILFVLPVLV